MRLAIIMIKLIVHINYHQLIDEFQGIVKFLQMVHQLI